MPRFKLVANPLVGEKQSAIYSTLSSLLKEKSPLVQDWTIVQGRSETRDVFYITLTPSSSVLTPLPEGTEVTSHLSIDRFFFETGPLSQRVHKSICHYTEEYQFPSESLWQKKYQRIKVHAYLDRRTGILDQPKIKGFKVGDVIGEVISFTSPVLTQKINDRAVQNAALTRPFLEILNAEKDKRYHEILCEINLLEKKLHAAFQIGKRNSNYKKYFTYAATYIATIEKLNLLNDQTYDPRGSLLSQFVNALRIPADPVEIEWVQEEVRQIPSTTAESVRKKEVAERAAKEALELGAMRDEYTAWVDEILPKIHVAQTIISKNGFRTLEEIIQLHSLKTDLQVAEMELCVFMERKNAKSMSRQFAQDLDTLLHQMENQPTLIRLFHEAMIQLDLKTLKILYPLLNEADVFYTFKNSFIELFNTEKQRNGLDEIACIAVLDFLLDQSDSFYGQLRFFVDAACYGFKTPETYDVAESTLGLLIHHNKQTLFAYLLSKGANPNGTGILYRDKVFSLAELIIVQSSPIIFLQILRDNGLNTRLSRRCLGFETPIQKKLIERKLQMKVYSELPLQAHAEGSRKKNVVFERLYEQRHNTSLLKTAILCRVQPKMLHLIIQKLTAEELAELSLADLILSFAVVNASTEINNRVIPSSRTAMILRCKDKAEAEIQSKSYLRTNAEGTAVSYIFYPADTSSKDFKDNYVASYDIIANALLQRILTVEMIDAALAELRNFADEYKQKNCVIAFQALNSLIYLNILLIIPHQAYLKIIELLKELGEIEEKSGAKTFFYEIYYERAQQVEQLLGARYRLHQPQPQAQAQQNSPRSTGRVVELS